jgi:hypothetical protein
MSLPLSPSQALGEITYRAPVEEPGQRYAEREPASEPQVRASDPNDRYFNPWRRLGISLPGV